MKHTKEHAESVFKSRMEGFPEDINFITMKGIFTEGYMTAIKETNTPELLEALNIVLKFLPIADIINQDKEAANKVINAIKKATE